MRLFILLISGLLIVSCSYQTTHPRLISPQERLSIIQVNMLLGQHTLAKRHLDQIEKHNQGRQYWRLVSLYWQEVGSSSDALSTYEKAQLSYPNDAFILNNYGVLLGSNGRWDEACEAFKKAGLNSQFKRQSVQINLARCALRQEEVKNARLYLNQAKEIAELPLIGLMTELILVLIQGNYNEARNIFSDIKTRNLMTRENVHFNEYNCLSRQFIALETDPASYSSSSTFYCLNGKV
ncbi:hypothetical protein OFY17_06675 [Marinomonas sp. C2222]|uniref:Tetratricopeptide repeat protein n=1 Tax=Marinomonas sargassi TaxID=2984494 RepID=A0ABT2YRT6_9GAMM|nr:tetratricopeptide repeat protein [Marinomonas sargassi]MCV2402576.1 hypothetical protein [Marinomonas sargassi]